MLAAKASGGGGGRALGEHPDGGPIAVRAGRFGAYVNWGKVNATIPKSISPDEITLDEAVELIAEREGRPARASARKTAKPKAQGADQQGGRSQGGRPLRASRRPRGAGRRERQDRDREDKAGRRERQDRDREDEAKGLNADRRKTIGSCRGKVIGLKVSNCRRGFRRVG